MKVRQIWTIPTPETGYKTASEAFLETVARAAGQWDPTQDKSEQLWTDFTHFSCKHTSSRVAVRGSVVGKQSEEQWERSDDRSAPPHGRYHNESHMTDTSLPISAHSDDRRSSRNCSTSPVLHPHFQFLKSASMTVSNDEANLSHTKRLSAVTLCLKCWTEHRCCCVVSVLTNHKLLFFTQKVWWETTEGEK